MLSYLKVENFAVVEKVELDFGAHLNILTGETGAGKSILIDAITLFLNKKVPEDSLRGEESKLVVEAMFSGNEEEFVFRREVADGKSLCFVNGRLVPFAQLRREAEKFLNIYGQSDHYFLLNAANHRLFLDEFCRNHESLSRLGEIYDKLKTHIKELKDLEQKKRSAGEKLDFIDFQVAEIEALKMQPGEDKELAQQVKILSSAEDIVSKSNALLRDLYQEDGSVYNLLADHLKDLHFLKDIYPQLADQAAEIERFYELLPEFSAALSDLVGRVEYDEGELDALENKLLRLDRLKNKYKLGLDELLDKMEKLKIEREALANMDFAIEEKQREIDRLLATYREQNAELRQARRARAVDLCTLIEKELEKLEMKNARFLVDFQEVEPDEKNIGAAGTDKVEFYFSSNPGQKPGQIKNVASGGELSRLMLVLKSIIKERDHSAYIFDEIDAGIGGRTAEFVGEKLKSIAESHQVICISHLPQIASFADNHFLITKEFTQDKTFSRVRELTGKEQVHEIGRLMVGSRLTEDALKAAENLLAKNSGRQQQGCE